MKKAKKEYITPYIPSSYTTLEGSKRLEGAAGMLVVAAQNGIKARILPTEEADDRFCGGNGLATKMKTIVVEFTYNPQIETEEYFWTRLIPMKTAV